MKKRLFSWKSLLCSAVLSFAAWSPLQAVPWSAEIPQNNELTQVQTQNLNQSVFTGSYGYTGANFTAASFLDIGSGSSTQRQPLGHLWGYERSVSLYTAAELTAVVGNEITKAGWAVSTAGTAVATKIYLKTTTGTLSATTWASMITGATLVYDGTATPAPANSWYELPFSTNFAYSGNNLLVLVETNYGGYGGGTQPNLKYTSSTNNHQYWYQDSSPPAGNGTMNSQRPNIRLSYDTPPPCSGTPTGGTAAVNPATGAANSSYTVTASGYSSAQDLVYQWYASTDNGITWNPMGSPSPTYSEYNATAPGNVGDKVLWRLEVLCTNSMESSYSSTAQFEVLDVFGNNNGNLPTLYNGSPTVNTVGCAGPPDPTITINVPNGKRIASLSTQYSMTALGGGWMQEQRSYIYSTSLIAGEGSMSSGTGNSGGTFNYNRALTFANGATGAVTFELRSFRTYGDTGCGTTFQYVNNGSWKLMAIYEDIPSCPEPTGLNTGNITASSADFSWSGSANAYDVEYGPFGFTQGTGTVVNGVTSPYTISGLNPTTNYSAYVRADCGNNDFSTWSGPVSFTTLCGVASVPYTEDFNSVTPPTLPNCTSVQQAGNGNLWQSAGGVAGGFSGTYLRYAYNSSNPANTWFYTQGIQMQAGNTYRITYKYGNNGYTEKLKVAYGTSASSGAMINLLADYLLSPTNNTLYEDIQFSVPADGVYYFGFNAYSNADMYYLMVDDISIVLLPNCTGAEAGTADETQINACANLPFTASVTGASNPASGLARTWQVFDTDSNSWIDVPGATDPSESFITDEPATIRYAVTCTFTNETDYSDEIQISIKPANQCYCVPTTTGGGTHYISNFTTTGGSANISNTSGSSVSGYTDFTGNGSLIANRGDQIGYSMSVAGGSNYGRAIWIDFNQNGLFEAGEQVVSSSIYESPPLIGTFNIPVDAAYGTTVMRILASYIPSNPSNPCTNSGSGEYEDYTVVIPPPLEPNIWENGVWSHGVPTNVNLPRRELIFREDFVSNKLGENRNTNGYGRIWGTNATVEAGVSVVFESDHSMVLDNELFVDSDNGGNITFKSGASLGQKNPNAENQGIASFERIFNMSDNLDQFNLVSSPVVDFNMQDVYPGTPDVFRYNEKLDIFMNDGVGSYVFGKGFRVDEASGNIPIKNIINGSQVTGVFTGVPANGNANITVKYQGAGFNLVGNPYPSILNLDRLYASNTNLITGTFIFWDNRGHSDLDGSADFFAIYNAVNQTGTEAQGPVDNGFDAKIPTNEVSVAGGFVVQALKGGQLKFKNSQRLQVDSDEPEFFGKPAVKDRYWLTMTTADNIQSMAAVVYFGEGNNGFGIDDSKSMNNNHLLYTMADDNQLVIQGKAPFSSSDVVPVGVKINKDGNQTIALFNQEGVFANGQNIFLKDKVTGAVHNLSQGAYQFNATVGQYNDRFEIIYNGFTDLMATTNGINIEKKDHNIVISSTDKYIVGVEIINLAGLPVYSKSGLNTQLYSVPVSLMKNQIVVVSVKTDTGEIVNKKFVNQ